MGPVTEDEFRDRFDRREARLDEHITRMDF
jgi:hypothetical protein